MIIHAELNYIVGMCFAFRQTTYTKERAERSASAPVGLGGPNVWQSTDLGQGFSAFSRIL
jgi:hypothetical protein